MLRELDQIHSAEELARGHRDLRPWFARPAILVGAVAAGGPLGVLFLLLLSASPG